MLFIQKQMSRLLLGFEGTVCVLKGAIVKSNASIRDSLIMEGACIESEAVVARSVVGPGMRIKKGHRIIDGILMNTYSDRPHTDGIAPIATGTGRLRPTRRTQVVRFGQKGCVDMTGLREARGWSLPDFILLLLMVCVAGWVGRDSVIDIWQRGTSNSESAYVLFAPLAAFVHGVVETISSFSSFATNQVCGAL